MIYKDNLRFAFKDEDLVGWKEAVNFHERWLQSVLNNVVYYLNEPPDPGQNECDYCLPCREDKVTEKTFNHK